jgi:4-hydroxybenzoate polyprenyltransferase
MRVRAAAADAGAEGRTGGDGQVIAGDSLFHRYVNLVKLPHTVFALPFALLGVVYASYAAPITVRTVLLVVIAFTAARFTAMGFNRIVDRDLDARNPRTRNRELPAARLTVAQAAVAVFGAAAAFVGSAALLNPLCLALSPIALAWILGYSYAKRFTALSHAWLGLGLGIAPAAGYLAVTGAWSDPWWVLPAAAAAVTTWVARERGGALGPARSDRGRARAARMHRAPSGGVRAGDAVRGALLHWRGGGGGHPDRGAPPGTRR